MKKKEKKTIEVPVTYIKYNREEEHEGNTRTKN